MVLVLIQMCAPFADGAPFLFWSDIKMRKDFLSRAEEKYVQFKIFDKKFLHGVINIEGYKEAEKDGWFEELELTENYERVLITRLKKKYEKAWNTIFKIEEMLRAWYYDNETHKPRYSQDIYELGDFGYYYNFAKLQDLDRTLKNKE